MLKSYFILAVRNFAKRRAHALINIFGLSIAIACCLLVYLFVNNELNYDKFHTNHEEIYRLNVKTKRGGSGDWRQLGAAASVMAPELAMNMPEIRSYVRTKGGVALVKIGDDFREEEFTYADAGLFEVFTFPMLSGEYQSLRWDANSVILSQGYAEKWFDSIDPVGKIIEIKLNDEFISLVVKGVTKKLPSNSSIKFNFLLPYSLFERHATGDWLTSWHAWGVPTYLLMEQSFDKQEVENRMTRIMQSHFSEENRGNFALAVQPMDDLYLNEEVRGFSQSGSMSTSWIMMAIACFILIIACINFTNLSIGMALPRIKEIGVRKVVGASRSNLLSQLLGETLLYTLTAFVLAVLIADLLLSPFGELTNMSLNLWSQLDANVLAFAALLIVVITLLAGSYPALTISRFNAVKSLKSKEKIGTGNLLIRSLVVVQFALAVFFVLGVVIMHKQVEHFYTSEKGYDDTNIVTSWIGDMDADQLVQKLKSKQGSSRAIQSVTAQGRSGYWFPIEDEFSVNHYRVDYDYMATMGIGLMIGRNFDKRNISDETTAIIVNKAFLKVMGIPLDEAIGQTVPFHVFDNMRSPKIIGVIDNVNLQSLTQEVRPSIFHMNKELPLKELMVKINEGELVAGIAEMDKNWNDLVDYYPYEYEFLETKNQQQYAEQESEKTVVAYSGFIAILISCLGLFALSSLHIQQRTKEVGIRKTLGASFHTLMMSLSKEFTIIVLVAVLIASPLAWYFAEQWLSNFAYRITINPIWFVYSSVLVVGLAYLSIGYQTLKTANANPVDALRDE